MYRNDLNTASVLVQYNKVKHFKEFHERKMFVYRNNRHKQKKQKKQRNQNQQTNGQNNL